MRTLPGLAPSSALYTALLIFTPLSRRSLRDGKLGVTLLRSPIAGDLRIFPIDPEDDYDFLGQGIHEGRMRIRFGQMNPAEAFAMADHFADPPVVIDEAWHTGKPVYERSFCTMDSATTGLTVLKQAEDGSARILRLAEYGGQADTVTLRLGEKAHTIEMKPYEIKTVQWTDASLTEVTMLETYKE